MATQNDDSQSVILKVSEAIGTALDEFHLAVEALGWAVAEGDREHAQDLGAPRLQGFAERFHDVEARAFQLIHKAQEGFDDAFLLEHLAAFVPGHQEGFEFLLEQIQVFDGGLFFEVDIALGLLLGREIVGVFGKKFRQATLPLQGGIDTLADCGKALQNKPYDVEAIRDDQGLGKVFLNKASVGR